MAEPKIKPSQAWFGFDDPELKTPAHDALMLWIDEYICEILVEVLELPEEPEIVRKEWEQPILNERGFVAGVPDLIVKIRRCSGTREQEDRVILIEAKPKVRSLGELIRQIRICDATGDFSRYVVRAINGDWIRPKWLVIAPDDRFAKTIKEQGILFHKSPKL
jgi:hypothetical protein